MILPLRLSSRRPQRGVTRHGGSFGQKVSSPVDGCPRGVGALHSVCDSTAALGGPFLLLKFAIEPVGRRAARRSVLAGATISCASNCALRTYQVSMAKRMEAWEWPLTTLLARGGKS